MTTSKIKTATPPDEADVISVLMLAFSTDPVARWSLPDPSGYVANFPVLCRAFGGNSFSGGTAFYADGFGGAALWLPPETEPDIETLVSLFKSKAPEAIREEIFGVFEEMDKFHPAEPHWYLPLIGVDPARQNQGIGTALMNHALELCDKDHLPAYLESSNPRNIPLYERQGFKVIGEIQSGSSPVLRPMYREAR